MIVDINLGDIFLKYRFEVEEDLEKTSIESEVYDTNIDGEDDIEQEEECVQTGAKDKVDHEVERIPLADVVKTEYCITSLAKIIDLLHRLHGPLCKTVGCDQHVDYKQTFLGTCLVVNWRCSSGHFGGRWASQPTCANLRSGNLLLASAIAISGNSFIKIGFLFKIMKLKYISKNLYNQYQNLYIAPTVDDYWKKMKEDLWKEREGKEVILSSDGRMDSPGHCAQYCTYTFADMETKSVLNLNIVDVWEVVGRKSPNMERMGFERGLDDILKSSMNINEIVTDGHLEISALMSKWSLNKIKYKYVCVMYLNV